MTDKHKDRLLRAALIVAAAPPLVIGAMMVLSGEMSGRVASLLSDAKLEMTPEFRAVLRVLGLYVAAFGVLMAAAARNPGRHRAVVLAAAGLFAMRGLQRLVHAGTLATAYGVDPLKNALHVLYLLGVGCILWGLLPRRGSASPFSATD